MDYCDFEDQFYEEIEQTFFKVLQKQKGASEIDIVIMQCLLERDVIEFDDLKNKYPEYYNMAVEIEAHGLGVTD